MSNKSHFFRQSSGVVSDAFIATFRTTSANESITLPYLSNGTYSGTIDFGDGTVVANSYVNRTHTYINSGDYDVTILGGINGFNFDIESVSRVKIRNIKNWGVSFLLGSSTKNFNNCTNLDITANDNLDLTGLLDWQNLFANCSNLEYLNGFNFTNPNSVVNFRVAFEGCTLMNARFDDLQNVPFTSLTGSFQYCENFNNDSLTNWDTSNVTEYRVTFRECFAFNQDISSWDFSGITSYRALQLFMNGKSSANYNAEYYDNLLIKWASSPSLGGLPVGVLTDPIDMGTIKYTANGASARASILANNKAQTIIDGGLDLVNSTPFISVFRTTSANESITLPYISNGTYNGTIDWGDGTVVANTYANRTHTYTDDGFYTVTILGDCVGWNFYFGSAVSKDKIYDIVNWGIGFKLGSQQRAFFRCTNLDITATDILDLTGADMGLLFYGTSILQFNESINNWDILNITTLTNVFNTSTIFNQPLNNWDTSNVTSFQAMFKGAFNFNQDISNWNFSSINSAVNMQQFMLSKSSANYDATYYDNLLIKWASSPSVGGLQPNIIGTIDMGTIKYTANGASARASILANNKAQTINDGGQI